MDSRLARWIALSVFAILIVGWVLAAVALTGASAGSSRLPTNRASTKPDPASRPIVSRFPLDASRLTRIFPGVVDGGSKPSLMAFALSGARRPRRLWIN